MKVVITGANGMIGASLARELIAQGDSVLAIVRPGSAKGSNLPQSPLIRLLECDVSALESIDAGSITRAKPADVADTAGDEALFAPPYDVFYHFAWNGTYGDVREDYALQERNIRFTLDAVALAARLHCARFVGAGSQAEYGRVPDGVRLTADTPTRPVSGYGAAKLSAGLMAGLYAAQCKLAFNWVRILSVYGPMDKEGTLTISTIRKLLRGEHAAFTGGGQIWDFLYCGDAARALMLIGRCGRAGAVYVLGSGQPLRLADALTTLARTVSPDADFTLGELPYRPDQCMYLCADLSALTADTGFTPRIPYGEGIRRTVRWCQSHPAE